MESPTTRHWLRWTLLASCLAAGLSAQEMQPRAYFPAPVGFNFVSVGYSNNRGGLLFDPSLPIEDSTVNANIATFAFGRTLDVLGRTAQAMAILPYVQANLEGLFNGNQTQRYRSGLGDSTFRFAINLKGAPAMHRRQFAVYRQKTIVGASLTVTAPTGQYDPGRIINIGAHKWSVKPEVGVSRATGKWAIEGAAGVWLYSQNSQFNGRSVRKQYPLGSVQASLIRALPHRTWGAVHGTYFTGGRSQIDGQDKADYIANARLGFTLAFAISPTQAIKVTYFRGAITRMGGDINSIGLSYTVVWPMWEPKKSRSAN